MLNTSCIAHSATVGLNVSVEVLVYQRFSIRGTYTPRGTVIYYLPIWALNLLSSYRLQLHQTK